VCVCCDIIDSFVSIELIGHSNCETRTHTRAYCVRTLLDTHCIPTSDKSVSSMTTTKRLLRHSAPRLLVPLWRLRAVWVRACVCACRVMMYARVRVRVHRGHCAARALRRRVAGASVQRIIDVSGGRCETRSVSSYAYVQAQCGCAITRGAASLDARARSVLDVRCVYAVDTS
jgi:hypothetical protein